MSKNIFSVSQNIDIEKTKKEASKLGVNFKGKTINKYSVGIVKQDEEYTNAKMPDIYEFLADINNSDVKTPTWLANALLNLLPKSIWKDENSTFLDPCVKSGVFLREIIKRLSDGLKDKIPDTCERIGHILKKQVFGISLEEIGSLLARRSIYCARFANDELRSCAISKYENNSGNPPKMVFNTPEGNIRYQRCQHTWKKGRCVVCGASEEQFGEKQTTIWKDEKHTIPKKDKKGNILHKDNHCYEFIHNENIKETFNMKFDVIIGNPPYQLSDRGENVSQEEIKNPSAIAIYPSFVLQALKLSPKNLIMIIPARWLSGGRGKGINELRNELLYKKHLKEVHIFEEGKDCFPHTRITGGIMYFLYDSTTRYEKTKWVTHNIGNAEIKIENRDLSNISAKPFIRDPEAKRVVDKIWSNEKNDGKDSSQIVFGSNPYSLRSNFKDYSIKEIKNGIKLYYNGGLRHPGMQIGWLPKNYKLEKNKNMVNEYKIIISKTIVTYNQAGEFKRWNKFEKQLFISGPNSCSTETYLVIKPEKSNKKICENIISYMKTKFFFFLLSVAKPSHNTNKDDFCYIPLQDWNESWNDEKLYKKYKLSNEDIAIIDKYAPTKE